MIPYFCFREAQNQEELEKLLKLRYQVYRGSRLSCFCPENPWALNMDSYDCYARHFGLFRCEQGRQTAIGYMRVIQEGETPTAPWIRRIARRHSSLLLGNVSDKPENPFPLMNYVPGAKKMVGKILEEGGPDEKVCEASRLIIHPEYTSTRIGKFVIESAIAIYFFELGFQKAMVACSETHSCFYRHYGFLPVEGTTPYFLAPDKTHSLQLLSTIASFFQSASVEIRHRIALLAQAYHTHQCIHIHQDRPGNYAPPPEVGSILFKNDPGKGPIRNIQTSISIH